jgi:hypothetical protein
LAAATLETDDPDSVLTLVERCHESLRKTRGVAMSLVSFNGDYVEGPDDTLVAGTPWSGLGP